MADSVLVTLSDAIVASLKAVTLSLEFDVYRAYRPVIELADIATTVVTVIPKSVSVMGATRCDSFFDCAIDIGVQRKISPEKPSQDPDVPYDLSEVDELMQLVQEIGDHLRGTRLTGLTTSWISLENEPVFASEHLVQHRQFTSLLTITYRVRR
ncbi:MAG: hypothetical protein JXO22_02875 [Phycisphaerae bacterium]|nr:hypothetical protein [Phycisphaerae bacterium]